MEHIITALVPIFSLILIGYFFKYIKFPSDDFWVNADKLTYFVLMPSLLIYKLSTASLESIDGLNFILTGVFSILLLTIILIIINKYTKINGSSFTSVVQGAVRFNTYIFFALSVSLFGDVGVVLAALLITFLIPLINVICITIFAIYGTTNNLTLKSIVKSIVTNPLIIACFIGGSINFIGFQIPVTIESTLEILSAAALPMGLLSVGVGLELKSLKDTKSMLFISSSLKLVLLPIIMYSIGLIFEVNSLALSILIIFASMPTAPSSFVLARQLNGDIKLMSSIITIQTLVSIFTMAVIIQLINL